MSKIAPSTNQKKDSGGLKKYTAKAIRSRGKFSLLQLLFFAFIFASVGGYIIWRSFAASPPPVNRAPGELLIRFNENVSSNSQNQDLSRQGASTISEIPDIKVKRIRVPEAALDNVKDALSHNPDVDFVEYNSILQAQEQLPNDPYFPSQYALGGGAWGWSSLFTHTSEAWDITQGDPSIKIAILDTGIKPAGLADFNGQIASTWNTMNNTSDATTNAGNHGTYVAGVAGLAINNGVGNAGYCPKCQLMPIQVGTDTGALLSDMATGLTYAADHGARVANMSWAGTSDSSTISSATTYAHGKGVIMFAAAGNSNCDCKTYPSADPYVLGVGGYGGNNFNKAGDSNFGNWVAFAAPEGNMTAWPTINGQPGYAAVGGTSLASPAAAGMAGLVLSKNPSLSEAQLEQALKSTATPATFSVAYGNIDPLAALESLGYSDPQPASVPVITSAPQTYYEVSGSTALSPLSAAPQVGQILVRGFGTWNGSSPLSVTSMQWQRCDTAGVNCVNLGSQATYTVQSADAGSIIKYIFTVKNNVGSIPASVTVGTVGGSTSLVPGDINSDGHVDITDLSILLSNYSSSNSLADINHDGIVDILDLSILLSNYGR